MAVGSGAWLHAVFGSPAEVQEALERLGRDGVPARDVEVRSSAPLDSDALLASARPASHVLLGAVIGGLFGGSLFFLAVKLTAEAYPLPTGGMPIVPRGPTGIITFEGAAIGAILSTVGTVLYECGLPSRWRPGPLDHYLADDYILVSVRCDDGASTDWAARATATARG